MRMSTLNRLGRALSRLPLPPTHTQLRTANKHITSVVYLVDILGQRCSLVSPRTPLNLGTQPPCPHPCCRLFRHLHQLHHRSRRQSGYYKTDRSPRDGLHRWSLRTFHNLMVTDPTSSILAELHQCYNVVFPAKVDFTCLPSYPTMTAVHALINRFGNPRCAWWSNNRLPGQDHIPFSQHMVEATQVRY